MVYADASALVKLVVREAESEALRGFLAEEASLASSVVAAVEVPRAVRRAGEPQRAIERANLLVDEVDLVPLAGEVIEAARSVAPGSIRTLDAIHVASALTLGEEISFLAYDQRLQSAARDAGLSVIAPGP